jgi:hypothetical protein
MRSEVIQWIKTYRVRVFGTLVAIMAIGTLFITWNLENDNNRQDQILAEQSARINENKFLIDAYYTALSQEQDARRAEGKAPAAPAAVDIAQKPEIVDDIKEAPVPEREIQVIREEIDMEELRRFISQEVTRQIPTDRELLPSQINEIAKIAAIYVPKPADGKPPTPEQMDSAARAAVAQLCANDACKGPKGDPPTQDELSALVDARLSAMCDGSCEGEDGTPGTDGAPGGEGPRGPEGPAGQDGRNVVDIDYEDKNQDPVEVECIQIWKFDRGDPINVPVPSEFCSVVQ